MLSKLISALSENIFPAVLLLALLDAIAVSDLRDILNDFLIGARNRKSARKIYREQPPRERVFLGYIRGYLKRHTAAFQVFRGIYLTELLSLIPQYAILFAVFLFRGPQDRFLVIYMLAVIAVKAGLNLFLRLQVDGSRRSRYREGK